MYMSLSVSVPSVIGVCLGGAVSRAVGDVVRLRWVFGANVTLLVVVVAVCVRVVGVGVADSGCCLCLRAKRFLFASLS